MAVRLDVVTAADIRFGAGRVGEVPRALADLGVTRVFLVTGRDRSRSDGLAAKLAEAGMPVARFSIAGEPSVEVVREALAALVESGSDGVLGFGGGSALDVAKALAALAGSRSDPMEHLEVIGAGRPLTRPALPCVAVPTTAGTGSEVTRNAVLSGDGVKASLRSPHLLPRVAVVDPDLLAGLTRPVIASSGMDALSQLIEPFLSLRANPFTDALARDGMRRSSRSLLQAYQGRDRAIPTCVRTSRWPACSAGCAWPTPAWGRCTASPLPLGRGSAHRTGRCARRCSPRRWTSTCGPCAAGQRSIRPCRGWPRSRHC